MAPHAYWNGHMRLSLVTFPVHLYPAVTATQKVELHKISRKTGERIHYANTTEDEKTVKKEDIVKGYEYKKGHFVPIDDKELAALKAESTHMIDLVQFTDIKDIDAIYFEKPYFVTPGDKVAQEAFVTIREALRKAEKVALGQIVIGNKERIAAIRPCGKGLILETMRYAYEIRDAEDYFDSIKSNVKVNPEQIKLANELIEAKTAPFDPHSFKDTYQAGLMEIVNAKLKGKKIEFKDAPQTEDNVVNIMDALKRSLRESKKPAARPKKAASRTTSKKTKKKAA